MTYPTLSNLPYFIWSLFWFIVPMPVVLVLHAIAGFLPHPKNLLFIYRVHRGWIGFWETMTHMHFQTHGLEKIHADQSYMIVANHTNILDIPFAGSVIMHPFKSLVKKELIQIPFLGWIIGQISIPVSRKSQESRKKSLFDMVCELEHGTSILVFPEGTRNRTAERLMKFYPGAFIVAIRAQKPILPVIITGTRDMQPVGTIQFHPGEGHLYALDPIPTKGLTEDDVPNLIRQTRDTMMRALLEIENQPTALAPAHVSD
ncbi:MAG: lysophospholipid acyltransferase family protein [Bacteroidota bacterium]